MSKQLADLLYPHVNQSIEFYEQQYPARNLAPGAIVTRFAPSPTGVDLHMGHFFNCLVASRIAKKSNGVYFLRVEDTDKKREVPGSVDAILSTLARFEIFFDEGRTFHGQDKGNYGPYLQSERIDIYHTVAKKLVEEGKAYPCFCTEEEIEDIRKKQAELKCPNLGYYGEFAKWRNASYEEVKAQIDAGKEFTLRLRCNANPGDRMTYHDVIKGDITLDANINDAVILKSDGIPPYNFAHVCDDHFMRTTLVVRGEEYSGTPTTEHLQIFEACGFAPPQYAHNPHIQKLDNGKKRKLSKSKDPEASMFFYHKDGYPVQGVIEYLLNIANSNFELWRAENPEVSNKEFDLSIAKLSSSGSLFDLIKLESVSKNVIATYTAKQVYDYVLEWANTYNKPFAQLLQNNNAFAINMFAIDRGNAKPRKDISKWSDTPDLYGYFFDEEFFKLSTFDFGFDLQTVKEVLEAYLNIYNENASKEEWFGAIKDMCASLGFAADMKEYKANPTLFKGSVADITTIIRMAATGRKNTPDLYEVLKLLGKEKLAKRFAFAMVQ